MVNKSGGTYSFTVAGLGTYTITPSKSGYGFIPYNKTFQNLSANQTQSFDAKLPIINSDITFFSIPAGSFFMGSSDVNDERPMHSVSISSFEIGVYEVTQGQYKAVMGSNPSKFTGNDNLPVEYVSWWDAIKFCNALSREKGLEECYIESTGACDFTKNGIRLPTEAEWEYACRAGTMTKYYTGDSEIDLARAGWYGENSNDKSHPVGGKEPNAWGLYDMHGNVAEWCNDWWGNFSSGSMIDPTGPVSGNKRVLRGGGWSYNYYYCRSSYPGSYDPNERNYVNGFRVVRRP